MSGAFSSAFSSAFDSGVPALARKRLVFADWVDDHERPRTGLWAHVFPVPSMQALLLFKDGTVWQRTQIVPEEYQIADWLEGAGTKQTYAADDWQVSVLTNAGYTVEDVA